MSVETSPAYAARLLTHLNKMADACLEVGMESDDPGIGILATSLVVVQEAVIYLLKQEVQS